MFGVSSRPSLPIDEARFTAFHDLADVGCKLALWRVNGEPVGGGGGFLLLNYVMVSPVAVSRPFSFSPLV